MNKPRGRLPRKVRMYVCPGCCIKRQNRCLICGHCINCCNLLNEEQVRQCRHDACLTAEDFARAELLRAASEVEFGICPEHHNCNHVFCNELRKRGAAIRRQAE